MSTLQKTYEYTPANLLSSVVHEDVTGDPESTMTWDADGNRISFTRSTGGTWTYVYDATAGIPAVIEEKKPLGSVLYVREPSGSLIASVSATTGQVLRYYHFDALGSTRLLTDVNGDATDTYSYDAWGNVMNHTGESAQPYQFIGQFGYYTHYQGPNLPLLQLGVRFYDPETGRFTQVDPAGDGVHQYAYVSGNPGTFVDPLGLWKLGPDGTITTALCKAVCASLGYKGCKWCDNLSGNAHCPGLASLCSHLGRHPETRKYKKACEDVYTELCAAKKKEKRQRAPAPVRVPSLSPDAKKAAATGLSLATFGVAGYFIIRTTLRVVCPWTNLVPAP